MSHHPFRELSTAELGELAKRQWMSVGTLAAILAEVKARIDQPESVSYEARADEALLHDLEQRVSELQGHRDYCEQSDKVFIGKSYENLDTLKENHRAATKRLSELEQQISEERERINILEKEIKLRQTPTNTVPNSIKFTQSPWFIKGDDIIRQYDFTGLAGPGSETMFQVQCTVTRGTFQLFRMIHFAIAPTVFRHDGFLVANLQTRGGESTEFFTVRVSPVSGGNLLGVTEREKAEQCFSMLCRGIDLVFLLLDQQSTIMRIPLPNDLTFIATYKDLERRIGKDL